MAKKQKSLVETIETGLNEMVIRGNKVGIEAIPPIKHILDERLSDAIEDSFNFQNYFTEVLDLIKTENPNKANLIMALNAQQQMFKIASDYKNHEGAFNRYMEKLDYLNSMLRIQ